MRCNFGKIKEFRREDHQEEIEEGQEQHQEDPLIIPCFSPPIVSLCRMTYIIIPQSIDGVTENLFAVLNKEPCNSPNYKG